MKAEINIENKVKFFALYWGWKNEFVFTDSLGLEVHAQINPTTIRMVYGIDNDCKLLLKPLSSISDEDAQYLLYKNAKDFKRHADKGLHKDELRVMGYTVNWHGLTVEEMINAGWIKLM